jgi:hypothetical protein
MLFDPPATSFHLASMERQAEQMEWRMNVQREQLAWVDPTPTIVPEDEWGDGYIFDGGGA